MAYTVRIARVAEGRHESGEEEHKVESLRLEGDRLHLVLEDGSERNYPMSALGAFSVVRVPSARDRI